MSALVAEPDFLLANHPHSANSDVHAVTQKLLSAGYKNTGFHSAKIESVTLEDGDTTITIVEGLRSYCGNVRVEGAKKVDSVALADILTSPIIDESAFPISVKTSDRTITKWIDPSGAPVKPESPTWRLGAPAPVVVGSSLQKAVQNAFASLGFAGATHHVTIHTIKNSPDVELRIEILDEGTQDQIQHIEVVGNKTNTSAEILAFLQIKTGDLYDASLQRQLTKKLYECGRFQKHLVRLQRGDDVSGSLKIEIEDVPGVPPLSQPLSDVAEILLRSRQWLSEWEQHGEDLVFQWKKEQARLQIVQSSMGTIIQIEAPVTNLSVDEQSPPSRNSGTELRRSALLIDSNELSISCGDNSPVWIADVSKFAGVIRLVFGANAAPEDDKFGSSTFHVNWSSKRVSGEPLLAQSLSLKPSGWCAFAYKKNVQIEQVDDTLILKHEDLICEIDSISGRLLRFASGSTSTHLQRGAFLSLRETLIKQRSGKPNAYIASKPVTSLVSYFESVLQRGDLDDLTFFFGTSRWFTDRSLHSAVGKMASSGLFFPLDAFIDHGRQWGRTEQFVIPSSEADVTDLRRGAMVWVSKFVLKFLPDLFAENTWPMKVSREACLVVLGRGRFTGNVLQELQTDQSASPLRDASIAILLSLAGKPIAKPFAARALDTLEPVAFEQDLRILFSGRCGKWITDVQGGIASLDEQEFDALATLVSSESFNVILQRLRTSPQSPGNQESVWYLVTKELLDVKLREILLR